MAWIEVHQSLVSHRKTLALSDALTIEPAHAVGHLVCLWTWSIDNAPHGDVSQVKPATLARGAGFAVRRADEFLEALVTSGFLDRDQQRLHIHDFEDYIGKLIARREANVLRTRAARSRHVTRTNGTGPPDVAHTNGSSMPEVTRTKAEDTVLPDTTVHNTTGPDLPPGAPPTANANAALAASCCTKYAATRSEHLSSCSTRVSS